jgi:hypothetical protein
MPSAIKETRRPISERGLRDNPPAEQEQIADKDIPVPRFEKAKRFGALNSFPPAPNVRVHIRLA